MDLLNLSNCPQTLSDRSQDNIELPNPNSTANPSFTPYDDNNASLVEKRALNQPIIDLSELSNKLVCLGESTPMSKQLQSDKKGSEVDLVSPSSSSRLDKFRSSVKGSLLMLRSTGASPVHFTDNTAKSCIDTGRSFSLTVKSLQIDDGSKVEEDPQRPYTNFQISEIEELCNDNMETHDSEDGRDQNVTSLAKIPVQRQNIFFDSAELEIDELKQELDINENSHIHFFKGKFSQFYTEEETLGEGSSGIVKKCIKVGTEETFAVKIVQYRGDNEVLTLIIQEFKNLRKLNHKNVIKVYDLYIDYLKKKIYTVMELADCREMFEVLQDLGQYSEAEASAIFKQIIAGVNYLHINGVCHRDLKPNNILVSRDGKIVKITDFNVSKFLDKSDKNASFQSEAYKMWTYTGTVAFTAPEVFQDNNYTNSVDMWSAGVVLYTMLCGYQPFQAEYVHDLIEIIKEGKFEFDSEHWSHVSKEAKDLVKHCLDVNPKTRYSPFDALTHPWISHKICSGNKLISIKENIRVYYKRVTDNQSLPNSMKKMQVSSPNILVRTTSYSRPRPRAGTITISKLFSFDLSPKSQKEQKDEDIREIRSIAEDLSGKRIKSDEKKDPPFLAKQEKSASFSKFEMLMAKGRRNTNNTNSKEELDKPAVSGHKDSQHIMETDSEKTSSSNSRKTSNESENPELSDNKNLIGRREIVSIIN